MTTTTHGEKFCRKTPIKTPTKPQSTVQSEAQRKNPRKASPGLSLAVSLALSFMLAATPVRAGFLQDFYDDVGAQTTSTEAGIYSSSTMDMVTGGRFVVKVPRNDFQPYYLQAPHLKAGCGGIDVFLGSFSVPSKEEFLNFLRSIGTALPGLAFQLALQGLAPDLNEQVSQFRDMLMRLSSQMGDSCQAAQSVLDTTGASAWLTGMGQRARNSLRTSGAAEDQSDADMMTRADGGKTLSSVPARTDSSGNVVEAAEMNLTWALLKGGKGSLKLDRARREAMMSLVGTVVYVKSGSGASTVTQEQSYPPLDLLNTLLGNENSTALPADAQVYKCDDDEQCLNPTRVAATDLNIANAIYTAMRKYHIALVQRKADGITEEEMKMLATISSLPLLNLVELSASPRMVGFAESYLQTYAQAAAYEAVLAALTQLSVDLKRIVAGSSARDANRFAAEHAREIDARIADLMEEMHAQEVNIAQRMQRMSAFWEQVEHMNRIVYGNPASDLLTSLAAPSAGR